MSREQRGAEQRSQGTLNGLTNRARNRVLHLDRVRLFAPAWGLDVDNVCRELMAGPVLPCALKPHLLPKLELLPFLILTVHPAGAITVLGYEAHRVELATQ